MICFQCVNKHALKGTGGQAFWHYVAYQSQRRHRPLLMMCGRVCDQKKNKRKMTIFSNYTLDIFHKTYLYLSQQEKHKCKWKDQNMTVASGSWYFACWLSVMAYWDTWKELSYPQWNLFHLCFSPIRRAKISALKKYDSGTCCEVRQKQSCKHILFFFLLFVFGRECCLGIWWHSEEHMPHHIPWLYAAQIGTWAQKHWLHKRSGRPDIKSEAKCLHSLIMAARGDTPRHWLQK